MSKIELLEDDPSKEVVNCIRFMYAGKEWLIQFASKEEVKTVLLVK
jgi:hypothetical protein